ncbi:hypothetical protein [Paenibacillus agilis]|uniref:Uncharacterized protein n=1 Tax=Paenibacillus agilis TaxID=3020863 RepID=A0A559IVL4_9BACL|nr:hypothetical protein [Paenibacillus agilis]TVX91682.1 hypothetical protein FPZ44_00590 [Paenibacillus agilis]
MKIPSMASLSTKTDTLEKQFESIALEEKTLSNLMQFEADKMLAFIGRKRDFPSNPSSAEIIQFNQSCVQVMESFLNAESVLFKKLTKAVHLTLHEKNIQSASLNDEDNNEAELLENDDQGFDF